MTVDPALLQILACPDCKVQVELDGDHLICVRCGRQYRIENGIPIMLSGEADAPPDGWQSRDS
jgi:uncharacterized protein